MRHMKGYILSLWSIVDPLYYRCTRLTYLSNSTVDNIFRIRLTNYKGKPKVLTDGTIINKNDTLVKIHLHNVKLLAELKEVNSDVKKAIIIYQKVKESLPGINQYIRNPPDRNKIQGIIGSSLLNRGSRKLGFDTFPLTNPLYKVFKYISFAPICFIFGTNPFSKKHAIPSYLFMSKKKLEQMYRRKMG